MMFFSLSLKCLNPQRTMNVQAVRWVSVCRTQLCVGASQTVDSSTATQSHDQHSETPAQPHSEVFLPDYRFVYPEFLPDPDLTRRHKLREKLERADMLRRRNHITIPEFYVGSIMAVTVADKQAPGKTSRFLGLCILREGCGLRATFTLRNVIEHQGVEVIYPLYNPTLLKIDVIRLEKRLDDDLRYLRDCPAEYSTFPQHMEMEPVPQSGRVPINDVKVPLNPRPWTRRWERETFAGLIVPPLPARFSARAQQVAEPWHRYDLMREYRRSISEQDQRQIFADVHAHLQSREMEQRASRKPRTFVPPKKTA